MTVLFMHFSRQVCSHANIRPAFKCQNRKGIPNIPRSWRTWEFIKRLKTRGHSIRDLRRSLQRAGELVQPLKCSLYSLENLSVIPRTNVEKLSVLACGGKPATGEAETGRSLGLFGQLV